MQEVQEDKAVIVNSVESVKQPKSVKDLRSMFEQNIQKAAEEPLNSKL